MKRTGMPVYMQIAIDMAGRIGKGEFTEDKKISGRSTLASEYNVSPETIRKAMSLLSDMKIVEMRQGSGIFVLSKENAQDFIYQYRTRESIYQLKERMLDLFDKKKEIEDEMNKTMKSIIDYTSRFKSSDHLTVYEQQAPSDSACISKSIKELAFWQNTGATVVGIKRKDVMMVSPGPYETIEIGDIVMFIGDIASVARMKEFLGNKK